MLITVFIGGNEARTRSMFTRREKMTFRQPDRRHLQMTLVGIYGLDFTRVASAVTPVESLLNSLRKMG